MYKSSKKLMDRTAKRLIDRISKRIKAKSNAL